MNAMLTKLDERKELFKQILGPKCKNLLTEVGDFLIESEEVLSQLEMKLLMRWISSDYRLNESTLQVCLRMAKGEINSDLSGKISHSKLKNIPTENMPDMNRTYTIHSAHEGKIVTKPFRDFTKEEIKHNIGNRGVITADSIDPVKSRGFKAKKANDFRIEDGNLVLIVNNDRLEVSLKITESLVKKVKSGLILNR